MRFTTSIIFLFISLAISSQPKKEYFDAKQTQLKSETDYYKGMPHGSHAEYYVTGKVSRRGFYDYGKEDSLWAFYYENGTKKALENYLKGKKWGTNVYYFKTGKVAQITRYENDFADSVWTSYFENGQIKSKETFEKGKKEGEWLYYFENGQLESQGVFEKDKKNGKATSFYKSGKPASIQNYCNNAPCGIWEEYYENGAKKFTKEYKDTLLLLMDLWDEKGRQLITGGSGSLTASYDNGIIKAMGSYKGGMQDGQWRFFHQNGELDYEATYEVGLLNGYYSSYFKNHKKRRKFFG